LTPIPSSLAFDLTPPTDDPTVFFQSIASFPPVPGARLRKNYARKGTAGGWHKTRKSRGYDHVARSVFYLIDIRHGSNHCTVTFRAQRCRPCGSDLGHAVFCLNRHRFYDGRNRVTPTNDYLLGHPIYSLSVLLFSLILTTGIGSFLSEKFTLHNQARITTWALITGGYLVILPFVLSELFAAFNDATLIARAALCVLSITPAGLLLGYGFPTGMRLIPPSIQTHALVLGD
jgi:hypothetical protein